LAFQSTLYWDYFVPWVEGFSHFSLSASIFLIISITLERYQVNAVPP
jgi:hypothetical protein